MANTLKVDLYWDLRSTIPDRHTGVGKHIIEVLRGLMADGEMDLRIWIASDQCTLWQEQSAAFGWTDLPVLKLPFSNKTGRLLAGLGFTYAAKRMCPGRDLVYSPMEILLPIKGIPSINTIHGIPCFEQSPLRSSHYYSWRYRYERLKQRYFFYRSRQRCSTSFVVSDYLKNRLIHNFGWPPNQLHTVYNGADAVFFENNTLFDVNITTHEESFHLLQVGGANAFDGAPALLAIASYLADNHPQIKIHIAGDRHEAPWEHQLRRLPNIVWLGFLSSEALRNEMRRARALIYVPTAESFGIIGVEAMAVGLPILAMRTASLPEVLGDAAAWIDPQVSESIENGLLVTCFNPTRRQQLIKLGQNRAKRYQWPNVVEKVKNALRARI